MRSVIGVLALFVAFTPLVLGSLSMRRRLLPAWSGPPGWIAQFVMVLTASILVVFALGIIGWYSLVPTTLLLAACGVALHIGAGRFPQRECAALEHPPERLGRAAQVMAVVATAVFAATWGARTYVALSHGMISIDSLWYHLPLAARYAELHSITGIFHDVENLSGFYPVNVELLHSLGMVLLGSDLLSMVLNLVFGVVALLAAWCIGRPHGMAAVCVTSVSVLLCAPAFVGTQPGSAHTDIVGVTLVLVVAALLVTADPLRLTTEWPVHALAAMAVGFAVGTKWTFVPIAAALTIGVLVLVPRGRRVRTSALWLGLIALLGSFSYLRNLVRARSPLPPIDLKFGPIGWARTSPEIGGMESIAAVMFDGDAIDAWLIPGLDRWFGYAWWAVLIVMAIGLVLAVATGPGQITRMLGVAGVVAFIGYLVQPQLLLLQGEPYFFSANIRYGTIAIALGLVLLPITRAVERRALAWIIPIASLAIIAVMQLDPTLWPTELRELRWEEPVRGADVVAGIVCGVVALALGLVAVLYGRQLRARLARARSRLGGEKAAVPRSARPLVPIAVALAVAVVAVLGLDTWFLSQRYARPDAPTPFLPEHWQAWTWARDIEGSRIGVSPGMTLTYPMYGNALSNHVEIWPGFADGPTLPPDTPESCREFVQTVNERRYDYVAVFFDPATGEPQNNPVPRWLSVNPGATEVERSRGDVVYEITDRLAPEACAQR